MKLIAFAILLTAALVELAHGQDGIPSPDRSRHFEINVCYTDNDGSERCSVERFPELLRDFGEVGYLSTSPLGPGREIKDLPNYPLARYHWWLLGFDVLPRLQRQIADTVAQIRVYQTLLGEYPRIDDPDSPRLQLISDLREYLVPMDALQNKQDIYKQPRLQDAIEHSEAAIASINERVFFLGLLKAEALVLYARTAIEMQSGRDALLELARLRRKKACR